MHLKQCKIHLSFTNLQTSPFDLKILAHTVKDQDIETSVKRREVVIILDLDNKHTPKLLGDIMHSCP